MWNPTQMTIGRTHSILYTRLECDTIDTSHNSEIRRVSNFIPKKTKKLKFEKINNDSLSITPEVLALDTNQNSEITSTILMCIQYANINHL